VKQKHDLINIFGLIINQNYFCLNGALFRQMEGLAMEAPSSAVLSEIFLQHIEHNYVMEILITNYVLRYVRSVDHTLIV
jgi:hypothetical protein